MEDDSFKQLFEVTDPQAAQLLLDREQWRILSPFMHKPCTLKEVADTLGMSLSALSYHVKRLLAVGLLEIHHKEARKGRALNYYRTRAQRYFIPFELSASDSFETFFVNLNANVQQMLARSVSGVLLEEDAGWGLLLAPQGEDALVASITNRRTGEGMVARALGADFPALTVVYDSLELPFETAKALQRDMNALISRYRQAVQPGAQTYLVSVVLAPLKA